MNAILNVLPALVQLSLKLSTRVLLLLRLFGVLLGLNLLLLLSDLILERVYLGLESLLLPVLLLQGHLGFCDHFLLCSCLCILVTICRSISLTWTTALLNLGLRSLDAHRHSLPADDLLSRLRCSHLLLLLQQLEFCQAIVELAQALVLLGLFLDTLLVPALNDSILGLLVVHEFVVRGLLIRCFDLLPSTSVV